MLRSLTEFTGHRFWVDDIVPARSQAWHRAGVTGHRQVTDLHLLSLAERYDGCVATFDQAMAAISADPRRVEVLNPH